MRHSILIRKVRGHEIEAVGKLCEQHASFEKADFSSEGHVQRLREAVFAEPVRVWCFVLEVGKAIVGYATCTKDFSTWRAADYVHMDCIYIAPEHRNLGLGAEMMRTIAEHAESVGCTVVEWQTPAWNEDAGRFYQRLGAHGEHKVRFCWVPKRK